MTSEEERTWLRVGATRGLLNSAWESIEGMKQGAKNWTVGWGSGEGRGEAANSELGTGVRRRRKQGGV